MSTMMGDEASVRPSRWLRRYAVLIVLLTLIGGAAAAAYAAGRPPTYSSSAQVLLSPSVGNPFSPETGSSSQQTTIAVATEVALVDSDEVMGLASNSTGELLGSGQVSAAVPPNTSTIIITARGSTADGARAGAQAVAESFLQYRQRVSEQYQEESGAQLSAQIAAVQQSLAATGDSAAAARRSDVLTAQLVSLQSALAEIQSARTDPGSLVSMAGAGSRTGISAAVLVIGGIAAGLIVGVALAFLLGRRNTSIHARSDAVVAGVPVLTSIAADSRTGRSVDATHPDLESFQQLRTFLLASHDPSTAVAIGGVGPADRSGGVALGLGQALARAGYRVGVVLASASEAGPFGTEVTSAPGLDEAVRDEVAVVGLVVERDGMGVLSPGGDLAGRQELLSGRRFASVVGQLKASFDYVLVVTGPVSMPGELAAARVADTLLLVATEGETGGQEVREVAHRAALVGLPVMGLTLHTQGRRSARRRRTGDASPVPGSSRSKPDHRADDDGGARGGPAHRDVDADQTRSPESAPDLDDRPSLFRW